MEVQRFRVTSPTRTLVDLCANEDPSSINASVDEFLRRRLTSTRQLAEALDRLGKRHGTARLRDIVRRYEDGECATESELEARALDLIDSAGLPRPIKQRPILLNGRCRRLDFAYVAERVVIEADGRKTHNNDEAFDSDRERINALTARGVCTLQWTWNALKETPGTLVKDLRNTLARRQREIGVASGA